MANHGVGIHRLRGGSTNQSKQGVMMKALELSSNDTYEQALFGWGKVENQVRIGQQIRVERVGLAPKTGYAYKEEGAWLGIRYTWRSHRWWSLLNYNNPLTKLEVKELDGQGRPYWVTLWKRDGRD